MLRRATSAMLISTSSAAAISIGLMRRLMPAPSALRNPTETQVK
jgi:hypothetical protein